MALSRNRFDGAVDGKTINDFIKQLDYNLTQEDKKKRLFDILYTQCDGQCVDKFFKEYYTKHYKANISKKDGLSQSNNISQALERMANYLLFSKDGDRISKKKMDKSFYTETRLRQEFRNEIPLSYLENHTSEIQSVDGMCDVDGDIIEDNYIDALIQNAPNYRKDDKQKIFAADLKDEELKPMLDYHRVLNKLRKDMELLKETDEDAYRLQKWKFTRLMSELKFDEILTKEIIKKPIRFKSPMQDSTQPGWLCFEECYEDNSVDVIKAELQLANRELIYDAGIIKYDLNCILEEISLNEIECKIVNMISFKGLTQEQIGKSLGISQQSINCYLNKIAHKILDRYEEKLEEVVYTHGMKGKYKTCSRCKNVKLANERYFHKDATKKDGFKYACKDCEK